MGGWMDGLIDGLIDGWIDYLPRNTSMQRPL